jgi:hypothetical protein
MIEPRREWDGGPWQDYCLSLLRVRHADHGLQVVPDRDRGDLGIEAFTHEGAVFQCYAAQEPLDVESRYAKQRDKLTEDIGKLREHDAGLAKLLGTVRIARYVFLVPRHDSRRLIDHVQAKAREVREWQLPFVDPDFTIVVETDDDYAAERDVVFSIPRPLVWAEPASDDERTAWGDEHTDLLGDARRKLTCAGLEGTGLQLCLDGLVEAFLTGENALEKLRLRFPDSWEAVSRAVTGSERLLAVEYPVGTTTGYADVKVIALELANRIGQAAPPLLGDVTRDLAWAAVADWLLRCPLDFGEPS